MNTATKLCKGRGRFVDPAICRKNKDGKYICHLGVICNYHDPARIHEMREKGMEWKDIALEYGISQEAVRSRYRAWAEKDLKKGRA